MTQKCWLNSTSAISYLQRESETQACRQGGQGLRSCTRGGLALGNHVHSVPQGIALTSGFILEFINCS